MEQAKKLQKILTQAGYKTLAVGGYVRDHLLGREPKDIDLATEALPEQIHDILMAHNIRIVDSGIEHGTVSAIMNKTPYEITTLRVDKNCYGRDAEVEFITSFEEDAKRRDFTVNALFMNLETEEIIDYVGGQEDLKRKILRFVGNPENRIKEDYLRILRLFRFSSQLKFQIDDDAAKKAIKYLPYMISFISTERIYTEMSKLIIGDGVSYIFDKYKDLVFHVFPEIYLTYQFKQRNQYHIHDVYTHTIYGIDFLKQFKDTTLSFAHLFHDVAKPFCHSIKYIKDTPVDHFYEHEYHGAKVAQRICHRLKFSTNDSKKISFLVANHMKLHHLVNKKPLKRLIQSCADSGDINLIWDLYKLLEADFKGQAKNNVDLKWVKLQIKESLKIFNTQKIECPLSGWEIMETFNINNGPNVGKIKDYLVNQIIEEKLDPLNMKEIHSQTQKFILKNVIS